MLAPPTYLYVPFLAPFVVALVVKSFPHFIYPFNPAADAGLGVFEKIVCVMRLRRFLQCNMMQPHDE